MSKNLKTIANLAFASIIGVTALTPAAEAAKPRRNLTNYIEVSYDVDVEKGICTMTMDDKKGTRNSVPTPCDEQFLNFAPIAQKDAYIKKFGHPPKANY